MTTCSICADQVTETLSALPCRHTFHHECIQRWFCQKPSCPNCNARFNRNSIIGPLFLDDANLLRPSKPDSVNANSRSNADLLALAKSEQTIAHLTRENINCSQKVRYLKGLRTIVEAESRMQHLDAQMRIQRWKELSTEQLASLLETATQRTAVAEEKLMHVQRENASLTSSNDDWRREKEFFESRYDKLRKSMKHAQKKRIRSRGNGGHLGSVVPGNGSKEVAQATVVDDSNESTDDESSTKRVVPKLHTSGDSSRKKSDLLPFGVPSSSRALNKRSLVANRASERSRLNGIVGMKRQREEEENDDDEGSTTDDGQDGLDQSPDDDSDDNDLDDIEIVPSRIENRSRHVIHSPSPPIIDLLSDDD